MIVSASDQLCLLVDTGADVSILQRDTIKGALEFEPSNSVKIKHADGTIMHTHGKINVKSTEGGTGIFHLPFS